MGEYADDYFRNEVRSKFGFDPGSMYSETPDKRIACRKCGKKFRTQQAINDHLLDYHKARELSNEPTK